MKIIMTRGLPGAGKSFFSKDLVSKDSSYIRVNKDDIRAMLGLPWSKENELLTLLIRDSSIQSALSNGNNVIVDDTNFNPAHEEHLRGVADKHGADFEIKNFDTPVWTCLERDALRTNPVGPKVIWEMYLKYLAPEINKSKSSWTAEGGKRKAIICDIDNTLAHMNNRLPHDYSKVKDDYCDVFVKDIVLKYKNDGYDVIIVSGREESCKNETWLWLTDNGIPFDKLFMRKVNDKRKDYIVKKEIYEIEIKKYYSVFLVLDDRTQVIKMWRELGLKCLECEYGNF